MSVTSGPSLEACPAAAEAAFGDNLALAQRYARLLADQGVLRGLIGPREPERLWTRHLLNCAAPAQLFPEGARVVDVGSGAGLPGLVLALARVDLQVDLVEPLARRVQFLFEAVGLLGLESRVRVVRGRADEAAAREVVGGSAWVTARAVAPLDRLAGWCLPLLRPGGSLVAMKGSTAEAEVAEHAASVLRLGGDRPEVVVCSPTFVTSPVRVVIVKRNSSRPRPVRSAESKLRGSR